MGSLGLRRLREQQAAVIFQRAFPAYCFICDLVIEAGDDATYVDEHLAHAGCPGPGGAE